jgi:hypothetical protein
MGGGTVPTPDDYLVDVIKNQYIEPTHPREDIAYCPVTAPMEAWPLTGLARLLGTVLAPPEVWGPGGAGWWPDEPWWKLTGFFDLTWDQSVQAGVSNLEQAMADHGSDHLVIYGISEGSTIATVEKRKLAQQYPAGTTAPDIDFVMHATPNLPNGGLHARFPGGGLPIGWSFDGPAPTDTQFDTVVINRQYDFWADFPLYPINLIADLNAFFGSIYVHTYAWDVSLPADPTGSPAYQGTHGDTSYYFFETQDLPLFGPLRTLGVPESWIDVVEPFFRVIVEQGYDRNIRPWEPTPARLIPTLDPGKVATDLVNAIGEGINNALAIIGLPPLVRIPAPAATEPDQDAAIEQVLSGPGTPKTISRDVSDDVSQVLTVVGSKLPEPPAVTQDDQDAAIEQVLSGPGPKTISRDVSDDVSQVLTAVGSELPEPPAVTQDDLEASQRKVVREPAATRDEVDETIGAMKSVIGNGRAIVRSAGTSNGYNAVTASPARKTPVRDAVKNASGDIKNASGDIKNASGDIKKVVTKVSDSVDTALRGGKDDDDNADGVTAKRSKSAESEQP